MISYNPLLPTVTRNGTKQAITLKTKKSIVDRLFVKCKMTVLISSHHGRPRSAARRLRRLRVQVIASVEMRGFDPAGVGAGGAGRGGQ